MTSKPVLGKWQRGTALTVEWRLGLNPVHQPLTELTYLTHVPFFGGWGGRYEKDVCIYVFVLIYLYGCHNFVIHVKPWKGAVTDSIYCIIRTMRNGLRKFSNKKTRALVMPKQSEYSASQRLLQKFYKLNKEVSTCKNNHVVGRVLCVTPHLDQTLGWLKPNPATVDAAHKPYNLFAV